MPFMGVQVGSPRQKESDMDKILKGVTVATQLLGTAFKAYDTSKQGEVADAQLQKLQQDQEAAAAGADPTSSRSQMSQQNALDEREIQKKQGIVGNNPEADARMRRLIQGSPAVPGTPAQPAIEADPMLLNLPQQDGAFASLGKGSFGPAQAQPEIPGTPLVPGMSSRDIEGLKSTNALNDFVKAKLSADAMASRMAGFVSVKQGALDETKNENAGKVGQHFETDPIIKGSKMSLNSLVKSQSILDNPNKPVTSKDLNLAYTDYINAVAAGGAATEGKITRELPETWAQSFNDLRGKIGEFDDLRKSPTGQKLVEMLKQNIKTVREDMELAVGDQAYNIFQNYQQSSNEKVQNAAKTKLKAYAPKKYAELFGGQTEHATFSSALKPQETTKTPKASSIPTIDEFFNR